MIHGKKVQCITQLNISKFYKHYAFHHRSLYNLTTTNTVTRLSAGQSRVRILAETRNLSSPNHADQLCCPPSHLFNKHQDSFPWVKWPECDVYHTTPPSSVAVKSEWSYISTPPICLHGTERDNFNLHCHTNWCHYSHLQNTAITVPMQNRDTPNKLPFSSSDISQNN